MDFDLSEDQLALGAAARDLLDDLASPARVRAHTETDDAWSVDLWAAMVDQGWLALEQPEAGGGLGLGAIEVAVLVEEMGRHAAPAPYVSTVLALDALAAAGE
ncbi:MAG: acyl-CoA dehydrogenase family protein, partial [Acidimicrobiia bacterium]